MKKERDRWLLEQLRVQAASLARLEAARVSEGVVVPVKKVKKRART